MMLIIFLGILATITSVSGNCNVGTQRMKHFDWIKATRERTWYVLWHSKNSLENGLNCVVVQYYHPEGKSSFFTKEAYNISANQYITLNGTVTNWNGTGFDENYQPPNAWSGRSYVIAINYKNYVILKHCYPNSTQPNVYVAFRSKRPTRRIMNEMREALQENNIDFNQLVYWRPDKCQQASSAMIVEDGD